MKIAILKKCVIIMLAVFFISTLYSAPVMAESDLMFSAMSNSIWVLKKSTRKLIFIQFKSKTKTWKSNPIEVPQEFNLDECELVAVGSRGTSVHLYDKSSGLITLFDVAKNHTVTIFSVVNASNELY